MNSVNGEKDLGRHTYSWCLLLTLLSISSARGEEDLFLSELPIIASASRLPQRLQDSPASVSVIDKAMIKAMGARDVSDILRIVPGFQTFVRNTVSPRVTYHGIPDAEQSSRIQVLIDGRSQFSPLFDGGVNWSLLPVVLENIERIEVIRGSSAASYGGNAFQALVNIVTIDPALTHGTSVTASHGNQGVRDYTLRQGGKLGEAGDYRFTYQQKRDSGLSDWDNRNSNPSKWIGMVDAYESQMFDWRSDFTVNNQDSLQITAGYIESSMLEGTARAVLHDKPIHDVDWSSAHWQASWRRAWSSDSELQLRYAFTEDRSSLRYDGFVMDGQNKPPGLPDPGTPFTFDAQGSRATRHEIELVQRSALNDELRSVWGASYRSEQVTSPLNFSDSNAHHRSTARVFGNLEWKAASFLTANLGGAAEQDSIVGLMPSGRASLNFHLNPENTIRLGAFRSERAGSIMDYAGGFHVQAKNYNYVFQQGNPDLGTERFSGFDLGYVGAWKNLGMHLDVRAFAEHIPNHWYNFERVYADCLPVTAAKVCGYNSFVVKNTALKTTVPVQDVHIRGIEYSWSWSPWQETRFILSQAFVKVRADYLSGFFADPANVLLSNLPGNDKYANFDQLTEKSAPSRSSSLLLMQKLPYGFEFSAFGQWVGDMKWSTNTTVKPYRRLDVRLAYPFRWAKTGGELAITAQSVGGSHGEYSAGVQSAWDDRIVERRQWLSLRLDF